MSSEPVAIQQNDYKVADISLADFGRKEISDRRNRDAGAHGFARGIWRSESHLPVYG